MSNSWMAPVFGTAVGCILIYMGYSMYNNNKESLNMQNESALYAASREDNISGGRKTKRRKPRKNASKRR